MKSVFFFLAGALLMPALIAALNAFQYCGEYKRRWLELAGWSAIGGLLALGLACTARAASIRIPESSALHRLALEREAASRFGLDAPVALIAAQIHQESRWKPAARSKYAEGLAQFTPPTAKWLPTVCPEIGAPDPWDAGWSLRAVVCYDHHLLARASYAATGCDRWAFALAAYNGGEVMLRRERKLAATSGGDASRWFDQVERFRARAQWAWDENRGYVSRILRVLEPAYLAAGWPGRATC